MRMMCSKLLTYFCGCEESVTDATLLAYIDHTRGEAIMASSLAQQQSRFTREWIICTFEELLYKLVIAPLVAFFPAPLAYGVARLRGDWRFWLDGARRKQIISNLEGVFSDQLSPAERVRVAHDFFRMRSCQFIDGMRLVGKGRALARLVEIRGLEHIEGALAAGKGAVLCDAHFGSIYSCASLIGARGFPITAVGNWSPNPLMSLLERLA